MADGGDELGPKTRIRLNPSFTPVAVDPNTIHFRVGPLSGPAYTIQDEDGEGSLCRLIELLDGNRTLESVLCEFDRENRSDLRDVIYQLYDQNVITGAPPDSPAVKSFLALSPTHSKNVDRIDNKSVLVTGKEPVTTWLAEQLGKLGADEVSISSAGAGKKEGITGDHDPIRRVESDSLETAANAVDAIVCIPASTDAHLPRRVNELAMETRTPWIHGVIDGMDGIVGPTILPGESSCYECLQERFNSTVSDFDRYQAYVSSDKRTSPLYRSFAHIITGYLSIEAVHLLGAGVNHTVNQVLSFDFFNYQVEANDVLRAPRCEICGPSDLGANRFIDTDQMINDY